MKTILDFSRDASPWVAIGFALGILASRSAANKSGRKKQDDNYAIEGTCIGMSFGTALEAARGSGGLEFGDEADLQERSAVFYCVVLYFGAGGVLGHSARLPGFGCVR